VGDGRDRRFSPVGDDAGEGGSGGLEAVGEAAGAGAKRLVLLAPYAGEQRPRRPMTGPDGDSALRCSASNLFFIFNFAIETQKVD